MREEWDAYDENENKLGYTLFRDEKVPNGAFHLVVRAYIFTKDKHVLVTQRAPEKNYDFKWENTGGSVIKGETAEEGIIREIYEETGVVIHEHNIRLIYTEVKHPAIYKCFVAVTNEAQKVTLQPGETIDYRWMPYKDFQEFIKTDEFVRGGRKEFFAKKKDIENAVDELIAGI